MGFQLKYDMTIVYSTQENSEVDRVINEQYNTQSNWPNFLQYRAMLQHIHATYACNIPPLLV